MIPITDFTECPKRHPDIEVQRYLPEFIWIEDGSDTIVFYRVYLYKDGIILVDPCTNDQYAFNFKHHDKATLLQSLSYRMSKTELERLHCVETIS